MCAGNIVNIVVFVHFAFWKEFQKRLQKTIQKEPPNGAQTEPGTMKMEPRSHLKKKHQTNDDQHVPTLVPGRVSKWNENHHRWGLGSVLFQGQLPSGLQTPARFDAGEVLGSFWNYFRQFGTLTCVWCFLHEFCLQHIANGNIRNHKKPSQECSRELPRNSFSLRAILHWKVH